MFYTSKRWFSRRISDPSTVTSHKTHTEKYFFTKLVRFEMYCFFFTAWQRSRHVWLNPPLKNDLHQNNVTVFVRGTSPVFAGGPWVQPSRTWLWPRTFTAGSLGRIGFNPPTVGHLDRRSRSPFLGGETCNNLLNFTPKLGGNEPFWLYHTFFEGVETCWNHQLDFGFAFFVISRNLGWSAGEVDWGSSSLGHKLGCLLFCPGSLGLASCLWDLFMCILSMILPSSCVEWFF